MSYHTEHAEIVAQLEILDEATFFHPELRHLGSFCGQLTAMVVCRQNCEQHPSYAYFPEEIQQACQAVFEQIKSTLYADDLSFYPILGFVDDTEDIGQTFLALTSWLDSYLQWAGLLINAAEINEENIEIMQTLQSIVDAPFSLRAFESNPEEDDQDLTEIIECIKAAVINQALDFQTHPEWLLSPP